MDSDARQTALIYKSKETRAEESQNEFISCGRELAYLNRMRGSLEEYCPLGYDSLKSGTVRRYRRRSKNLKSHSVGFDNNNYKLIRVCKQQLIRHKIH